MTVALDAKSKRTLDAVKQEMAPKERRRNISGLSPAELEGDIDYIMHVDHELPMEWYTKLDALKSDLAHLIVTHADAAVRRVLNEVQYTVAKELQENIASAILHMPQFSEPYPILDEVNEVKPEAVAQVTMKDLLA